MNGPSYRAANRFAQPSPRDGLLARPADIPRFRQQGQFDLVGAASFSQRNLAATPNQRQLQPQRQLREGPTTTTRGTNDNYNPNDNYERDQRQLREGPTTTSAKLVLEGSHEPETINPWMGKCNCR